VTTNQFANLVVTVSLFCPTEKVEELEQKISADWMLLWFEEKMKLETIIKTQQSKL
jgi:hypothetical protein